MIGLAFFDTNVLVYSDDAAAPGKQARALSLLNEHQPPLAKTLRFVVSYSKSGNANRDHAHLLAIRIEAYRCDGVGVGIGHEQPR